MEKHNYDNSIHCQINKTNSLQGLVDENRFPSYDVLGVFVDITNDAVGLNCESNSNFPDNFQEHISDENPEKSSNCTPSQYTYIEKCIPKWKLRFPWVSWCPEERVIVCLHCKEVLKTHFPAKLEMCNIITVTDSDEVYQVAKKLRTHHDNSAHAASIYIFSHSNLLSFISIFNNYYKDMKHESEVLQTVRSMFNYSKLDKDGFLSTVKNIGRYIEGQLLTSLKKSKYFSVVADQCRGIIIVRWVTERGQAEEHVFWSYLSEWEKTPKQYLETFGINSQNTTLYIANTLCQQCRRCQNNSVSLAALPPRPPSIVSFANLLWNLDFLRPLMSLVSTVYKLWRAYPYKFGKKFEPCDLKDLFNCHSKPNALTRMLKDFDTVKRIAEEIYEARSHIEALGVAMIDIQADEKHIKILNLIQEIMDIVKEATQAIKITDKQIAKLNQALSSLKMWSWGAKFIKTSQEEPSPHNDKSQADKVYEFIQFVEKFIDENQKSLYYSGRDKVVSFSILGNTKALLDTDQKSVSEQKLRSSFNMVYNIAIIALYMPLIQDRNKTYESVKGFHNHIWREQREVKTYIDILSVFHSDSNLINLYPEAYELFLFCSTMPFQTCHIARSLFVSFVIEQRLESSVWARMEEDIKPWLLYLQHELSTLTQTELLNWWLKSLAS